MTTIAGGVRTRNRGSHSLKPRTSVLGYFQPSLAGLRLEPAAATQYGEKILRYWCERGDSNPHGLPRQILSLVRLPISPLSHFDGSQHSQNHDNASEASPRRSS